MEEFYAKITAIIKTKNSGDFLCNTLESLSDSDEIFILDEHSNDDTIDIAKEYKAKVIFIDKLNPLSSFNQALEEARGEWFLIVHDDEIIPERLFFELKKYSQNPKKGKYAVSVSQKYFYLNKEIKCARKKDILRFFKKGYAEFKNFTPIEITKKQTKVYRLNRNFKIKNASLLKYSKDNIIKTLEDNLEEYKLKAKTIKKINPSIIIKPKLAFLYFYFIKGAVFQGFRGYIYSKQKEYNCFIENAVMYEKKVKNND